MSSPARLAEVAALASSPSLLGTQPVGEKLPESVAVVIPVMDSASDLAAFYGEYSPPLLAMGCPVEFLFVVDARHEHLVAALIPLMREGKPLRVLQIAQASGEAAYLKVAKSHTQATIIVTLPAAPRVVPEAVPRLVEGLIDGADLVVACRSPRMDPWLNRVQSKALHALVGLMLGRGTNDVRCGVRALRPRVLDETVIYGDLLLFLPIVASRYGFRVREVPAPQHPRDRGARFYSPRTYLRRLLDILAVFFLLRFSEKPLRFFGTIGFTAALTGAVLLAVIFLQRIGGQPIANRPILLLAGLLVVLGVEAIALGLIGEIIVYLNARYLGRRPGYQLKDVE